MSLVSRERAGSSETNAHWKEARPAGGAFRVSDRVIGTRVLGCVVLLDRATEQYLTLRDVAARIWELIAEGLTPGEIVDRLYDEYDVTREQLMADVTAQLKTWLHQRLIEPATANPEPSPRVIGPALICPAQESTVPERVRGMVVPPVIQCAFLILAFKMMLKVRGFTSTIDWIRSRVRAVPASTGAPIETVRAVQWPVAMAAALYPGRARCLEQSLVLYYLLRRQGIAIRHCQGVKPFPFQAHAWIEYRGEPINDVPEHAQQFARLPEQLP